MLTQLKLQLTKLKLELKVAAQAAAQAAHKLQLKQLKLHLAQLNKLHFAQLGL